jgi:hypothetical protein
MRDFITQFSCLGKLNQSDNFNVHRYFSFNLNMISRFMAETFARTDKQTGCFEFSILHPYPGLETDYYYYYYYGCCCCCCCSSCCSTTIMCKHGKIGIYL